MKIETKKIEKLKRKLKIEVEGEEFSKEREAIFRESSKNLKVPGFRPGSAPLDVLEKYHGNFLKDEFLKKALPIFYQKALQEEKIVPAGYPQITDVELTSQRIVFFAELETKPELSVKDNFYKGLKIKHKEVKVEEIEIEKIITNLQESVQKSIEQKLKDHELAHWASYPDVAALKEAIKAQLMVEKYRERRQGIDEYIKQHLLKNIKVEVPKNDVERFHKELVDREKVNLQYRGISEEDLEKYSKELEGKLKTVAEDEVRLFYIFEAIAKQEGLKVTNNLNEVVIGLMLSFADLKS